MNGDHCGDHESDESDKHSEGYFQDFDIDVMLLRPDGALEVKNPNWVVDASFGILAPAVYGSPKAWCEMTEDARAESSANALAFFNRQNGLSWEDWHCDYVQRRRQR